MKSCSQFGKASSFALFLPLILFFPAHQRAFAADKPEPGAEKPAIVTTAKAEHKPHTSFEEVVGTVQPKLRSVLSAKVSGRIEKQYVLSGQEVKAGDVLSEIEAADIKAKLDQAQAVHRQAQSDLSRFKILLRQNAVTQQDYDSAVTRERVARAAAAEASTMLGYAKITAPFDGVIAKKYADIGDLASPGVPLFEVVSPGALQFEAEIPEALIRSLKLGDALTVIAAHLDAELKGKVSEISPLANPLSRTFLIKIDLPQTPGLLPGQFGRVRVPVGRLSAIFVPQQALIRRGQMEIVYVISSDKAYLRLVKSGRKRGGMVEIISGLEPGETVAVEGAKSLSDHQPVIIH